MPERPAVDPAPAHAARSKQLQRDFVVQPKEADEPERPDAKPVEAAVDKQVRPRVAVNLPEKVVVLRADVAHGAAGDTAAEAVAKFLIDATSVQPNPTVVDGDGRPSAGRFDAGSATLQPASSKPSAPVAQTGIAVQQLFAGEGVPSVGLDHAARVLNASGGSGRYQVTMQLDPPSLGELKVELRMQQQMMTLRVDAQTQAVARLIESRLPELRDSLASHGIRVEQSEIVVRAAAPGDVYGSQPDGRGAHRDGPSSWSGRESGAWMDDGNRAGGGRGEDPWQGGRFGPPTGETADVGSRRLVEEVRDARSVVAGSGILDLVA